jgi:hypothetical protein
MAATKIGVTQMDKASIISLSDRQLEQVKITAAMLPVNARNNFMRSVAGNLAGIAKPSDHDVARALALILNARGVSAPLYLQDLAPTPNKQSHTSRKDFALRYKTFGVK